MKLFESVKHLFFKAESDPLDRYFEDPWSSAWASSLTAAGVYVTPRGALQLSAVAACVRVISQSIASLPWDLKRREQGKRIDVTDHPVNDILSNEPNEENTPFTFKQVIVANALLWGNGTAEIGRRLNKAPYAMWVLDPSRVKIKRDGNGRLMYRVRQSDGSMVDLASRDVFHLPGLLVGDGAIGVSPVECASQSMGVGLAAQRYGASFFSQGANPGGVIRHPGQMSSDAKTRFIEHWNAKFRGADNANKMAILDEGMEFTPVSIPPETAQFIATREFELAEICRWFGVPPHKIFELKRSTNNNIEHQGKEYVDDAVLPWAVKMEQEANRKLLTRDERRKGYYTKTNLRGLLRGDLKARSEFYKSMLDRGVYSINTVLELEDMDPVEGGDLRLVPLNMVSLEKANRDGETGKQSNNGGGNAQRIVLFDDRAPLNGVH